VEDIDMPQNYKWNIQCVDDEHVLNIFFGDVIILQLPIVEIAGWRTESINKRIGDRSEDGINVNMRVFDGRTFIIGRFWIRDYCYPKDVSDCLDAAVKYAEEIMNEVRETIGAYRLSKPPRPVFDSDIMKKLSDIEDRITIIERMEKKT
jgi:hypothetical protein